MLCLPRLVSVFTKRTRKMYFEVHPSFLRIIRSVPFAAVHRLRTVAFYQVFGDGHNLGVSVWVLKCHGFLSVLGLLHKGFGFCFSDDWDLHPLVGVINFLACESSVFAMNVSDQSNTCYS